MTARLTAKEAKRLGIDVAAGEVRPASVPTSRRTKEPYHTRCRKCDEHFTTMAGETRHMNESGHRAFELVLNQERNINDGPQGEAPARDAEQDEGAEAG